MVGSASVKSTSTSVSSSPRASDDALRKLAGPESAAAYILDWDAVGMSGITVTASFTYKSTKPVEGALLAVAGKSVEIRDGLLMWGATQVGPVVAGDVVTAEIGAYGKKLVHHL